MLIIVTDERNEDGTVPPERWSQWVLRATK